MIYHYFVKRRIERVFEDLNKKDYTNVLNGFAQKFEHFFSGDHALGGSRSTLEATRKWYDRLPRVLPDVYFTIRQVSVSGPLWDTRVVVEWRDHGKTLDGWEFQNQGVHYINLKWGRITRVGIYCDTVTLVECFRRNAASGLREAALPPILDSV